MGENINSRSSLRPCCRSSFLVLPSQNLHLQHRDSHLKPLRWISLQDRGFFDIIPNNQFPMSPKYSLQIIQQVFLFHPELSASGSAIPINKTVSQEAFLHFQVVVGCIPSSFADYLNATQQFPSRGYLSPLLSVDFFLLPNSPQSVSLLISFPFSKIPLSQFTGP